MKTRTLSMVAAAFLAVLMSGASATGTAQAKPSPDKMPHHKEGMHAMPGMSGMMDGPHHVLAMAYRDNLAAFARALQSDVTRSKTVNLDLARPAVAEMRRSFDQLEQHHQAHMAAMGDQMKSAMADMMPKMETHHRALGEHLTALESEVNAGTPDPKKVSEHTAAILKQCAEMAAMHPKTKPATPTH